MRVSSVMRPASSCGTFRSARMKTRLPASAPAATRSVKRRKDSFGDGEAAILRIAAAGPRVSPRIVRVARFTPRGRSRLARCPSGERPTPCSLAPPDAPRILALVAGLGATRRRARPAAAAAGGAAAGRLATAGAAASPAPSSRCACSRCRSTSRSPAASPRRACRWSSSTRTRASLEGKLQFPLGAGQVVSGFALDVDGQPARRGAGREGARRSRCSRTSPGAASTRPAADDARQQLRAARLPARCRARRAPSC